MMINFNAKLQTMANFIDNYNCTGYGQCHVIETKRYFVLHFWNAGYSENEEIDYQVRTFIAVNRDFKLLYDDHPIIIIKLSKELMRGEDGRFQQVKEEHQPIFNCFRITKHYDVKSPFKFEIEIE